MKFNADECTTSTSAITWPFVASTPHFKLLPTQLIIIKLCGWDEYSKITRPVKVCGKIKKGRRGSKLLCCLSLIFYEMYDGSAFIKSLFFIIISSLLRVVAMLRWVSRNSRMCMGTLLCNEIVDEQF